MDNVVLTDLGEVDSVNKGVLVEMSLGGDDRWHGKNAETAFSDAITMQAEARWRAEERKRKQKELEGIEAVALADAGDEDARRRLSLYHEHWGWTQLDVALHDREHRDEVLGDGLARVYGTGDPGAVWDAMNASADYEYEQMPVWNTRAEGMRLVWGRFQKMAAGKKAAADAAQAAVNERLKGLEAFADGKDAKRDEGGKLADDAITDGRLWELVNQGVLEVSDVQRAQKVREFMLRYVRPLGKRAEMDERMRGLDGLRDEVYELIGEDKDTARLFYESLMRWAGEQRDKGDTGAGDEFQVAVGKKLSDWSRVVEEVAPLALLSVGAPGPVAPALVEQAVGTYEARKNKNEQVRLSAGVLRAAIDEAMKEPEGGVWQSVKNAPRVAAAMAGDTLPYLVPFVGAGLGTADAFVRGYTSGIDSKVLDAELGGNMGGWESRKAMGNAAMVESGIQALVELMPWGRVGGKGLAASVGRKMKAVTGGKYVPGALSRALARGTQKSVTRALVAEFGANVVTEGLLEPIAQGALTLTAEGVMDLAGVEHGRSKSFSEAFAELGEIWEPEQLAGFLLFSAALTAPAYGQARKNVQLYQANVKKFAKNAEVWETQGLSRAEAEEAAGAEDPLERGNQLVAEGWKNDPAGMSARLVQKHKELKDSGRTLVFAGVQGKSGFDADTVKLLGEAWRASKDKYHLPDVELLGDGRVRLTRAEVPAVVEGIDLTLTAEQADAFLFQELNRLDMERMRDWQKSGGNVEEYEGLQTKLAGLVDVAMGDVAVDAAVAEGSMDVEEMGKGLPEELRGLIKEAGGMNLGVAKKISEWAIGQMEALEAGGMSRAEAREQVASEEGGATLEVLAGMGASMQKRLEAAGDMSLRSALNRRRGGRRVAFNGRSVLGSVLVHARGGATGMNAVEDISESVFDMMVQGRTEAILENQAAARKAAGEAERPATLTEVRAAEEQAWNELAEVASKAREALLKVDPDLAIEEVNGDRLNTIEALSTMAMSRYLGSGVLPRWMSGLVDVMRKNVQAAAAVVQLQKAMVALGEQDAGALKDLLEFLDDAGVQVGKSLAGARVEAVADRIRELARWNAGADAAGPGGVGGMSVSQAQEEVLEEEDDIQQNDKAREAVATAKPADAAKREDTEDKRLFEQEAGRGAVPERMRGVFVGDAAVYNAAGDFWCGQVEKHQLSDGTEQVKVGEKGKHGVIAGKELTGRFVNDTAPILVWKRRDGSLQVISGRHRFAKLMEDESATGVMCYVYEESEERDERWARMKDYEQNMRDDQADEVTCAVYARETGLTEAEMRERGLTRNGSRSKRGIFIGQHAREELWTRFRNGEIKPMDAELVCKLTAALADQSQVAEIQAHCCGLLKAGKSWDYIGASVQLMASSQAQQAEQMLLDLGADFTADLERMARWVELCRKAFREAIDLLKDEKRRVKKGAKASRLGLSATMTEEKREEMLGDLEAMDAKFEMIGSYPELVAEAKMWDGDESKFADPVAMYLERVEAMQAEGLQEEQTRKAAEEATGMFNWSSSLTPIYQENIIADLRKNSSLNGFMDAVDKVELSKQREFGHDDIVFGELSDDDLNNLMSQNPGWPDKFNLKGAKHIIDENHIWHVYRGHCLDYFIQKDGLNLTYDDIRLIPDILKNYDTIKPDYKRKRWGVVYIKRYGDIEYRYSSYISKPHRRSDTPQNVHLATGWITKKAVDREDLTRLQPQATSASRFHRTAIVTPMEEYIKQNYAEEAKKIAEYAKKHDITLHAPNGMITNLTPVQWLAVRLQSFKAWFGDWENDPANASKVVDENGEPLVVYHGSPHYGFTVFDKARMGERDKGDFGRGFYFTPNRGYASTYGNEGYWNAEGDDSKVYACFLNIREPMQLQARHAENMERWKFEDAEGVMVYTDKFYDLAWNDVKNLSEIVVHDSTQIKSATDNRGTFDGSNPDITYSVTGGKNLAAVHSIPVDTMLDVEKKLGGLPKPSIAITRLDKPYSWGYSERVYLIGKPELADPQKGNLVYDRDAWTGKGPFLLEGGGAYDYRKGEYFEPKLEEFVARTIKKKGQEDGSSFRGQSAVAIGTMDAVKAHREKLSDTDTSNAQKAETDEALEELIENVVKLSKKGLNEDAVAMVLARVCWRSSPMNHGAPSEMKTSRDTAKRILNELGVRVKDIKKPLVDSFMKAVAGLQNELEDYLESVPQRAVMFNEWEYAVMPESMKGTPGLDEMLERNGIKPVWHDGTEEGRRAALAGLVDNPVVSFSVIGRNARTWGKYTDRAFVGRDDGMWRAEIDASGAKLKARVGTAGDVYRRFFNGMSLPFHVEEALDAYAERQKILNKWYDIMLDTDDFEAADAYMKAQGVDAAWHEEVNKMRKVVKDYVEQSLLAAGVSGEGKYGTLTRTGSRLMQAIIDSLVAEKVNEDVANELNKMSKGAMRTLGNVLDYPELYEAYPDLKWLPVYAEDLGLLIKGKLERNGGYPAAISVNEWLEGEMLRSTLLHEVQHAIQTVEEFASGGNAEMARNILERDVKRYKLRLEPLRSELRWINAVDSAKDVLKRMIRVMKRPRAILKMAERFYVHEVQDVDVMAQEAVEVMWKDYQRMAMQDAGDSDSYAPGEGYALPGLGYVKHALADVEGLLAMVEALPSRRAGKLRGRGKQLETELERLYDENRAKLDMGHLSDGELYLRIAGEIESRNVQHRMNWSADKRAAVPFNDTLEYPGEALVTYSLTGAAAAGRRVLEESGDEYVANRLQEAWQKNLEKWSVLNAGKADANSAMRAVMEMEGLVKATYDVVQDDVKLGRLYMLQRWAMVYARMVESGEIPPKGALKGQSYEKFVERLAEQQRTERRRGMSREQAEELVKELGVSRLEGAMEKVARECMRAAEWHLKQKETARVKRLLEAAWPKREEGKKSPRGKLAAREYRRLEWIAKVMELSAEDKYKETQRIIREIDELPQELVGYEERVAELEGKLAALDPKQADYVERKAELDKAMRELNPNEVGYDEAKAELEDQLNWLHVFGGWAEMDVSQARKAARALEDLLLRGYTEWERKVQRERERTRRVADEISAHFKAPWYATSMERKKDSDKAGTNKAKMLKGMAPGLMSYAQLMLSLRKKLGNVFCDRQRRTIAEAHRNLLTAQKDLQDWSAIELQKITGLTGAALEQWIAGNNQNVNTGIMMQQVRSERIRMNAKEVDRLGAMSENEYEAWRDGELAKAEADGRAVVLPTAEELLVLRGLRLEKPRRKWLEVERTEQQAVELVATKEAMLYAVLLFEQPDYEHLVEAHGLSGADVLTMKKLIGPKLLRWGYAMRRHLNENGELLAAKYEAWNGTPFGRRANYFRGVFDVNKLAPEVDIQDDAGATNTLGGNKYSILIPRRYHRQQINWQVGASQVFMLTMNEQNNYIHTQHITREWRQLLSRKRFADGLAAEVGASVVNAIKAQLNVIDAAPNVDAAMSVMFSRFINSFLKAAAISALALNVYSYMKQVSCLLNAIVGGYVPDAAVKQSGVYQVLTYSGIGAGELVRSYARVLFGRGAVSFKEMTGSAVIQSRIQSGGKRVADALMMRTGQAMPNAVGRAGEVSGEWALEKMDMIDRETNTVSAMVVADAVYRKLAATEGGKNAGDKWVREQAIEAAGLMVDLVAQPKLRTQKGLWASGRMFGGIGNFLYMFRSETLAKVGTYLAQMMSGEPWRALGGWTSMGVLMLFVNLLCQFIKGQVDGDDMDEWEDVGKLARKGVADIMFNDISSLPVVGGSFNEIRAFVGGGRSYQDNPFDVVDIIPLAHSAKKVTKAVDKDGFWSFKAMRAICNALRESGGSSGWGMGTGSAVTSSAAGIILGAAVLGNAGRFVLDVAERVTEE